jgi:hypothetical protein
MNKMTSKKNEPQAQPAATSGTAAANEPTQSIPATDSNFDTEEQSIKSSTPFDSFSKESGTSATDAFGAGVWHNNKKINGQWSKAETRNSWIGITDLGWKKISPATDTSVTAITIIAASALETQTPVNVLLDNDQVVELYNW